jgi:hypothetical protein
MIWAKLACASAFMPARVNTVEEPDEGKLSRPVL